MSAVMEREQRVAEPVNAIRIDSIITYPVDASAIVQLKSKYAGLSADTPKGFEECRVARAKVRGLRVDVEKHREMLKKNIIEAGKRIDSAAKVLTADLLEVEEPIDQMIKAVEAKKEQERKAKEEAERAKVEAELKARHEAEQARLKAERDAEEAKLKEERERLAAERKQMEEERAAAEAERKRLDALTRERQAKIDAENAERQRKIDEQQKAEQDRLAAEQKRINDERERLEAEQRKRDREEFERQAKIKAEKEAKEKIEADRLAKEKADAEHKAWQESERVRIEALKPDYEKLHNFAKQIRSLSCPGLQSDDAKDALHTAMTQLAEIAECLESFRVQIPY